MPLRFEPLALDGLILITPQLFRDERGAFAETFKVSEFSAAGIEVTWRQMNYSLSQKHVVRGMHYQLQPHAQGKLVSVLHGHIFDVVIDIRKNSPSFGHWTSVELEAEKKQMLWIPPGFAHGFCALTAETEVMYAVTAEYAPASERGILWNDPAVDITWPIDSPILSDKDAKYPLLKDAEINFL